jgi:hypothetical protein
MKGSNSRFSHRVTARYSNIAQVQGGMITDADLTEAGQLHQARDQALGRVAAGAGVPATGGMVKLAADGTPSLQAGDVVAAGQVGRFVMTGTPTTITGQLAAQADLPDAPVLGTGPVLLYADIWDRPVFALQDPYLADAGLHGAQTSYRTRRMVQIKALPLGGDSPAPGLAALAAGTFPFATKGSGLASIAPRNVVVAQDLCDPCATEVQISQVLPNALFRIEVITVARNQDGSPATITLAWSLENAESLERVANLTDPGSRDAFARDPAVYEFFNDTTEAQIGAFPAGITAQRPLLTDSLYPAPMGDPAYTHVRRWDGAATVALSGAVSAAMGAGVLTRDGAAISLALEYFTLAIDFAGAEVLAGDFWLVELRRFAPEADQLRLVGATNGQAPPCGIDHAFCPLFVTRGDVPVVPQGAGRRQISMPSLADIPADHVSYDPACPDWFGPVDTVQGALDAMCNLPASKLAYTPPEDCDRFAGATTVAAALDRLCKIEDNSALSLVLRSMMDWGVVCGLRLSRPDNKPGVIAWSAGVALDPAGRIVSVPAGSVDLNSEKITGLDKARIVQTKEGEVCFALSFDADGTVRPHLVDKVTARPTDPTRAQATEFCEAMRKGLRDGVTFATLNDQQNLVLRKVNTTLASHDTLNGAVGLTVGEAREVDKIADGLLADYGTLISATGAEEIKAIWTQADKEFAVGNLAARPADKRRMQLAVAKIATMAEYERRYLTDCECDTALTPCPPEPAPIALVPLGCITFETFDLGQIILAKICTFSCRKQAITWRADRYHQGSVFDTVLPRMQEKCCTSTPRPETGELGGMIEEWQKKPWPEMRVDDPPLPGLVWPPRRWDDFDGGFTDPKPNLMDFGTLDAVDTLTGHGFEVVEVVDLDQTPDGLDQILTLAGKEDAPKHLDARARPGDRVVLITRGGKALDFKTIGAGSGRFRYATRSDGKAIEASIAKAVEAAINVGRFGGTGGAAPVLDTGAIAATLQALAATKAGLETDIAGLDASRQKLTQDVGGLKVELAALEGQRTATAAGVKALEAGQAAAQASLVALQQAQGEVLRDVRVSQPVESLNLAADVTQRLKAAGVVTVKDVEGLSAAALNRSLSGTQLNASAVIAAITAFAKPR